MQQDNSLLVPRAKSLDLRERTLRDGPQSLGNIELLAVLLGTGAEGQPAPVIAASVLSQAGGLGALVRSGPHFLALQRGVGAAKAARVSAAFELGLRASMELSQARLTVISSINDVHAWATPRLVGLDHEEVWILMLDARNALKASRRIALGGMHGASLSVSDVLRPALCENASSIIVLHNHPSGDPTPSNEDIVMTRRLAQACSVVHVPLMDHVVVARGGVTSLYEACGL